MRVFQSTFYAVLVIVFSMFDCCNHNSFSIPNKLKKKQKQKRSHKSPWTSIILFPLWDKTVEAITEPVNIQASCNRTISKTNLPSRIPCFKAKHATSTVCPIKDLSWQILINLTVGKLIVYYFSLGLFCFKKSNNDLEEIQQLIFSENTEFPLTVAIKKI